MGAFAVCDTAVREAAEEGGVYYAGILLRFVEKRDAKVAIDANGNRVLSAYRRQAMESKLGGKNIADWLRLLARSYAHNFEKVHVDDSVSSGPALFIHVAGSIVDNPALVVWSGNDYRFVRDNMPRVAIVDRDQAIEFLADPAPSISGATTMVVQIGDSFHGISDSTIINRSRVIDAFNTIADRNGQVVAEALVELARIISASGNLPAEAVFESFRKEASKPEPERSALKKLWDGLVSVMGDVAAVADLGLKLAPLWS